METVQILAQKKLRIRPRLKQEMDPRPALGIVLLGQELIRVQQFETSKVRGPGKGVSRCDRRQGNSIIPSALPGEDPTKMITVQTVATPRYLEVLGQALVQPQGNIRKH